MKKIVVIDDEKDFGLLMKNFFGAKNYDVHVAYTIEEGMRLLEQEKPDYIFLDNDMPDGAGWCQTEHILINYPNAQLNLIRRVRCSEDFRFSFPHIGETTSIRRAGPDI